MEVRILGPLEVEEDGESIPIGSPKERAVLEVLALRAGDTVGTETLIDALWGFEPPRSAANSLQSHVSRLRRTLPVGAISTEGAGYRLAVSPEDVDAYRFERLVAAGGQAVDGGDHRRAVGLLDRALELWRGRPFIDLSDSQLRIGQAVRLEELYLAAAEARVDAHLALGHHEAMAAELEARVTAHPLRERFWAQLMLALYRSDRRADALGVFQRLRGLLREELGIDPSNDVRELEVRILQEDPDLVLLSSGPPSSTPTPLTSFIGREEQRREVGKLLREHRLVTLLGPGGVGLVIVDNAEEIADDLGRWLSDLLETAPSVTALVTSRVPLRVAGERRYSLPPMEIPGDDPDTAHESEAMRLFLDRLEGRGHPEPDRSEMSSIATLCRMADGLPLGIELLASRVGALGPVEVLVELEGRRELLVGPSSGRDERHASLGVVLASTMALRR